MQGFLDLIKSVRSISGVQVLIASRSTIVGLTSSRPVHLAQLNANASLAVLQTASSSQLMGPPNALRQLADLCGHNALILQLVGSQLAALGGCSVKASSMRTLMHLSKVEPQQQLRELYTLYAGSH